ncbi:MAG: radical SAM protein, partial [Nitrospirae bacterium]|nr:radical SAM protein [Nitrospirota bacterium]
DLDVTKIEPAVQLIKKYGIKAKVNILVGCGPLETKKTIGYNRKMVRKLDFNQVMYNICNPFPGTELYKTAKEEGWFIKGDYYPSDVQKEVIIKLPHLSPKKLKRAVRIGNLQFFLRPKFIIRNIREFATFKDFIYALKVLKRKLV